MTTALQHRGGAALPHHLLNQAILSASGSGRCGVGLSCRPWKQHLQHRNGAGSFLLTPAVADHSIAAPWIEDEDLRQRCEGLNWELREAVEALESLVDRGCRVEAGLLFRLVKRCVAERDVAGGRRVHVAAMAAGFQGSAFLGNHIIGMYAKHGELEAAMEVFEKVLVPNAHVWTSIILANARAGRAKEAIALYRRMRESGSRADSHVFVAVLTACAIAGDLSAGKEVHSDLLESKGSLNSFVGNSLVHMYAKCGSLELARDAFETLETRDVVSWNAMIAGYAHRGRGRDALSLFWRMELEDVKADDVTYACVLKACAGEGYLEIGREVHDRVRECGMEGSVVIGSGLVDMYAKCGSLEDARRVFDELAGRNVVTWNAMIGGYAQQGRGKEAMELYGKMRREVAMADQGTFVAVLQACGNVGALQQGRWVHAQAEQRGMEGDLVVGNCLVDMYCKCGSMEDARRVFQRLEKRDVVTWNALLTGYAEHCDGVGAVRCWREMREAGCEPNGTTFLCLLVACSHAGMVGEGREFWREMVDEHGVEPGDMHYNCMVDLLGRAGRLEEAEEILQSRKFGSYVVGWTALLTACKSHADAVRGLRCFERLVKLEPENSTPYVLLGSIYASAGRWEDVDRVEGLRRAAGAWKKPAKACIEVENQVHEFTVGEKRRDVSSKLRSVNARLKQDGGHVPQTSLVLKPGSEQEKEDALCGHAEKLALAYGLLNTPDGTPLLVTKNLRMCGDCHSSTKIMSRLEQRDIVVRDAHRVHRFVSGSCSCGDRH